MKAIRVNQFGSPDKMVVEDVQIPEVGTNQILISVKAIGINPVETYIRAGIYPLLPELPFTPGKDAAGTIFEIGDAVEGFKKGDRVYCSGTISGTYAEMVLCQSHQVHLLPDIMSFEAGAAIGVPGAAAWRALSIRGNAQPGESILIHGASGSVGLNAIQIAKHLGLRVFSTAGTEEGLQLIKTTGADYVFNHRSDHYVEEIQKTLDGKGINLIIEMLANKNLATDLTLLAPKGRVVIVGSRGTIEIDPRATMGKESEIRGLSLFSSTIAEELDTHQNLSNLMKKEQLKPVISQILPFSDAPKAHEMVMKDGNCGKIILTFS